MADDSKPKRTLYTYKIPKKLCPDGRERSFGIVPLTRRQEALLMERAATGKVGTIPGLYAQMSIAQIDGVQVNPATDEEVERFLEDIGPQARSLVTRAVMRLHTVTEEDAADFFETVVVSEV